MTQRSHLPEAKASENSCSLTAPQQALFCQQPPARSLHFVFCRIFRSTKPFQNFAFSTTPSAHPTEQVSPRRS